MRNIRKTRAISLAAMAVFGLARPMWAATETWTPTADLGGSYSAGIAAWNTTGLNWSNGSGATAYAVGDNVIFEGTPTGNGDVSIALTSGGLNPSLMEFTGSGGANYTFLTGSSPTSSSTPFSAANYPENVILDSSFNGTVHFQANAGTTGQLFSQIAINGGTLEIDSSRSGALPDFSGASPNNFPAITLGTATLGFNESSGSSAGQLGGLLQVTGNGTMAVAATSASNKPEWDGAIDISNGDTLTITSASSTVVVDLSATGISGGTIAVSPSTVLNLATAGSGSKTTTYALGASGTIESNVASVNLGALTGGTGSTLTTTGTTVYSVGALAGSTFSGAITGTTDALTKVNTAANTADTLTLNGTSTYNGVTSVNGGTLQLDFSAASAPATDVLYNTGVTSTSALTLNGGTLSLLGKASTSNIQQFALTNVNTGTSSIQVNANATANPFLLGLGSLNRAGGGSVDFTLPTGAQSATNGIITTTGNANVAGGQSTIIGGYATVGGNTWAVSSAPAAATGVSWTASGITSSAPVGSEVDFTGTGPSALSLNTAYWVVSSSSGTINVSATPGGTPITLTDTGVASGTLAQSGSITGLATASYSNTGSIALASAPGKDIDIAAAGTNSASAAETVNSIRFNDGTGTSTIDATNGLTIATGGILVTSNVGNHAIAINNGTLASSSDLNIIDNDASNTLTINSQITGTGGLMANGPGTVVLTNATNSYAGKTYVDGGATLNIGADLDLGTPTSTVTTGAITLNGGTLQTSASFAINADRGISMGVDNGTIDTESNTITYAGAIGSSGALDKAGTGDLVLSGTNTYTGGTNVLNGTLEVSGTLPASTLLTLGNATGNTSGVLQLDGSSVVLGGLTTAGSGTGNAIVGGNSGTALVTFELNSALSQTFSGTIGGSGTNQNNVAVTVGTTGSTARFGTLTLSGANTYNGQTLLSNGTVVINTLAKVGAGPSSLGDPTTPANGIIGFGTAGNSETGALLYVGTGSTTDRVIDLQGSGGDGIIDSSGSGALIFTGNAGSSVTASNASSHILLLQGSFGTASTTNQIQGSIVDNGTAGDLTSIYKLGTGAWELSGANTYTGGTTISAGILQAGSSSAYGTGILTDMASGTADLNGFNVSVPSLFGTGVVDDLVAGGTSTLNLTSTLGAVTTTFTGNIQNTSGTVQLVRSGGGTQIIGGIDTYTGGTAVQNGDLQLASSTAIPTNSAVTIGDASNDSGTLDLGGFNASVSSLNSVGTGANNTIADSSTASGANSTLIFNGSGSPSTYAGSILDHLNYLGSKKLSVAVNSGSLTLSGNGGYTGGTTITGGILSVGSTNALGAFETQGSVTSSANPDSFNSAANPGSTTVSGTGSLDLKGLSLSEPVMLNGGTLTNSSGTTASVIAGVKGIGFTTTTEGVGAGSTISFSSGSAAATLVYGITAASFSGFGGTYSTAPNVTITPSDLNGSGATGTLVLTSGTVTGITITNPGSGYDAAPIITAVAGTGVGAGFTATGNATNFGIDAIQMTAAGNNYATAPTATLNEGSGATGVVALTPIIGSVTLNSTSSIGGNAGNISLALPVTGVGGLTKVGTDTLTLSAVNTYGSSGGTTVNGGTLLINPTSTANTVALPDQAVSIGAAGKLALATNASASTPFTSSQADISNQLLKMTSLSITPGGVLDVGNNHFNVADSVGTPNDATFSTILGYVKSGAITSSDVNGSYGIGVVDGDANIAGTPVSSGQIEVAYTLNGDANLDGKVDATDFGIFAPNFGATGFTLGWEGGDFNYDGKVDATDFGLFAPNFGQSDSGTAVSLPSADYAALDAFAAANGLSLTSVPEPATLSLLALGSVGILARRRRRGS